MNTWPKGFKHALTQTEHEQWNAHNYPGTRQMCVLCDEPTGNCEEDSAFFDDVGPLCVPCHENLVDGDQNA